MLRQSMLSLWNLFIQGRQKWFSTHCSFSSSSLCLFVTHTDTVIISVQAELLRGLIGTSVSICVSHWGAKGDALFSSCWSPSWHVAQIFIWLCPKGPDWQACVRCVFFVLFFFIIHFFFFSLQGSLKLHLLLQHSWDMVRNFFFYGFWNVCVFDCD